MLSSENLYSVKFFDYNAINRMKLSTVTDLTEHSYTATTYAYDGFGRRTITQTEGHTANRTLYDGTGFEILRQGTADSNGSFVNYTEAQNRYSPYYPYNGGGYSGNRYGYADYFYYLFFGGIWGFGNGGHGSKNGQEEAPEYLTIENMYPLYANGSVSGTFKEDLVYSPHKHYWNSWTNLWGADTSRYDDYATYKETLYFGTDVLGSVRTTSSYSVFDFGSINYDVFGSPYRRAGSFLNSESLDFGYLGKPYNATTELYDYGFRDYSPRNARFTTVDPIRDGRNWYTYVLNDPVNYVDLWGLECQSGIDSIDSKKNYKSYPYEPLTSGGSLDMYSLKKEALIKANTISALNKAIYNHIDDKYSLGTKEKNYMDHYRCDNFVETVINEAGGNSLDYIAGKANATNVQETIDNYINNNGTEYKKTNAPVLSNGAYTVNMNKSNVIDKKTGKPLIPHTGVIIKDNNGIDYIDNSSGNNNGDGGVQRRHFTNEQSFQNTYGYQSFFYQEILIENSKNLTNSELNKNKQLIEEMYKWKGVLYLL